MLVRDASAAWLRKGVEASLDALGTDHIDLYQVHWPDPQTPISETAAALADLVREGLVRHAGVSNYTTAQIEQFATVLPVETVQPPYHLFRRDIETGLLPYAAAHHIGVLAYGPLAHGLLGGTITATTTFGPGDWRAHSPAFTGEGFTRNLQVVAALRAFAARRGATIGQLAVAWVLANPAVQVAIVGARTPAHLAENIGALNLTLSQADLAEIDTIMAAAVPVGGPTPEGMSWPSLSPRPRTAQRLIRAAPAKGPRQRSRSSAWGGWAARWPPTWPAPASTSGCGTAPPATPPALPPMA